LPYLLYLQGGPGGRAARPGRRSGWVDFACRRFRVILLDQRGTGCSSPVEGKGLALRGNAQVQADYLAHFRADSIVADAELLRTALLGPDGRWSLLGQSFGGFCTLTYLSFAPDHVDRAMITGGLPALSGGPEPVYRACYPEVRRHNEDYFAQYPDDRDRCVRIAEHLATTTELLPTGARLTPRLFQTLGFGLGLERRAKHLHYLLESAFLPGGRMLSDMFLRGVEREVSFAENPLFPVQHELIYCQGQASRWSAERIRGEFSEFDLTTGGEFLFTGEMTYPLQFDEPALAPLRDAAHLLAERSDWPALYDPDRLADGGVPVAAAIYQHDMYVNVALSQQTADRVGGLRRLLVDDLEHDGLDLEPERILGGLLKLLE
jgi:pimeloyl-ACP methyl ester carboxylesterase